MSTAAARGAGYGTPSGFETLSVDDATAEAPTPGAAKYAVVSVEGDTRWRSDGTSPTASVGMFLPSGSSFEVGQFELGVIEFIATSTSATVSITYYV